MNWIFIALGLGSAVLLGAGLSMVVFVSSAARTADSFVALFRVPLRV